MSSCAFCGFTANPRSAIACALCGKHLPNAEDALPRSRRKRPPPRSDEERWRRYLLVQVGAAPIELSPGETLTLGRGSECGLTIPSQRVSRIHAEVFFINKQPMVKDLGSENGTLVNGMPIREHALCDRDEIRIGPYSCTYRVVSGRGSVGKLIDELDSRVETEVAEADLRGSIEQVGLITVLGLLDRGEKTGRLEVSGADCPDGYMVFRGGAPLFAQVGEELAGRGAALRLLMQERGVFRFVEGPVEVVPNIEERSVTGLILEHGQAMDRRGTMRADLDLGDLEDSDSDLV